MPGTVYRTTCLCLLTAYRTHYWSAYAHGIPPLLFPFFRPFLFQGVDDHLGPYRAFLDLDAEQLVESVADGCRCRAGEAFARFLGSVRSFRLVGVDLGDV